MSSDAELKIKMTTNTAYLLNTWFPKNSKMWEDVKKFIEKAHEEHWKKGNSGIVEVTFKMKGLES